MWLSWGSNEAMFGKPLKCKKLYVAQYAIFEFENSCFHASAKRTEMIWVQKHLFVPLSSRCQNHEPATNIPRIVRYPVYPMQMVGIWCLLITLSYTWGCMELTLSPSDLTIWASIWKETRIIKDAQGLSIQAYFPGILFVLGIPTVPCATWAS